MFATILFVLLGLLVVAAIVGITGLGVWMFVDNDGELSTKFFGAGLVGIGVCAVLFVAAVVTGQLNFGDNIPDGCYYVSNELRVLPVGKTVRTYHDREFFPIPCPGGMS